MPLWTPKTQKIGCPRKRGNFNAPDGCPAWRADVRLDDAQRGWTFCWGVIVDTQHQKAAWGIPNSSAQERSFELREDGQVERYWLTHCRRLGANKFWREGTKKPALTFSVWAPNAREVDVVIGDPASGYIWSDGRGAKHAFKLAKRADGSGTWESDPEDPALADFTHWDHQLYMFRIRKDNGSVAYRTDLYSRCQIGSGCKKPEKSSFWRGSLEIIPAKSSTGRKAARSSSIQNA